MSGRLPFALTATILLFLLHGLAALLAALFGTVYDALYPTIRTARLLPALLPLIAIASPAFLIRRPTRGTAAAAAATAAAARLLLCLPQHEARLAAAAALVAAAAMFLVAAPALLGRRGTAAAFATAILADQLLRLTGWSWDLTLRPWWWVAQLPLTATIMIAAWHWSRGPAVAVDESSRDAHWPVRAIVLGLVVFLDLHILARPEVAARWLDGPYAVAAVWLISAGAAAAALLLLAPRLGGRVAAVVLGAIVTAAAVLPHAIGPLGLMLFAAGHAAALLLLSRLVAWRGAAGGRSVALALATWLTGSALYAFTFFPSFTVPALQGAAPVLFALAGVTTTGGLVWCAAEAEGPVTRSRQPWVALLLMGGLGVALAARPVRQGASPAEDSLRVATWNVHLAFSETWRFDPGAVAATLEQSNADVVALQEVGSGVPVAYGVDLALYLAHRLGMQVHFAPTHNRLMGDAVLTRVPAEGFSTTRLPPDGSDARQVTQLNVMTGRGSVELFATRLSIDDREQLPQMRQIITAIGFATPAVLLGDLNAEMNDTTITLVRAAGFRDVFELAGVVASPTSPARRPTRRIDWIWVRGLTADSARVLTGAGSDHRLVMASLRIP